MRRLLALAGPLLILLGAPAGAQGAVLETLSIDPGRLEVTSGTVTLKAGTEYSLRVSGTYSNAGPEGYGYEYDALYCFDVVNFTENSCTDHHRAEDFKVRTGSSGAFKNIDAFGDDGAPYRSDHTYVVSFTPTATGALQAGMYLAYTNCTTCETTTTGGLTVEISGPGGGGGGGGGGGSVGKIPVSNAQPACDDTARAVIAARQPCKFGDIGRLPAPARGTASVMGSDTLPGKARQVEGLVDVQDAADEKLFEEFVVAVVKARQRRIDQIVGCLVMGGVDLGTFNLGVKIQHPSVLLVLQACSFILTDPKTKARAAADGCQVAYIPVVPRGTKPKAVRRARRAFAAKAKVACDRGAGSQLHFSISARGNRTLNPLLGKRVDAAAGTLSPAGSQHSADSKMLFGWGYRAG